MNTKGYDSKYNAKMDKMLTNSSAEMDVQRREGQKGGVEKRRRLGDRSLDASSLKRQNNPLMA